MCGRFVSVSTPEAISAYFDALVDVGPLGERYNVAPTSEIYGVVSTNVERRVRAYRWGLVPTWAKDPSIGNRMINARAETVAEKPSFRASFRSKRCIIPMDGFYEWRPGVAGGPTTRAGRPAKLPVYVHPHGGEQLAVAGLWSAWRDPADPSEMWLHTATVITTAANATMSAVHDRMPVILPRQAWEPWLDPDHDAEALLPLLVPAPDDLLIIEEVSTSVNDVRNDGPDLVRSVNRDLP